MAQATNKLARTQVAISRNERVVREERTALFGLLRWWVEVSREKINDDLVIETEWEVENIYFNGKKIYENNHVQLQTTSLHKR